MSFINREYLKKQAKKQKFVPSIPKAKKEVVKVCNACGYPLDASGMCTAPLSNAD